MTNEDWFYKLPQQIRALIMYLPAPGSIWPEEERAAWFLLMTRAINKAYPARVNRPSPVLVQMPDTQRPEYWYEATFEMEGLTPTGASNP
jgi:hypothetical protein